ncbi:MAG: thiamine phosphate synthase [Rhodobacteraceae bacterium]|nr:thiamine phosphate synthase [Paracoccaceae bacterium]
MTAAAPDAPTSDRPQIYLITPPDPDPGTFPDLLARVLDAHPVACLRLMTTTQDGDRIARMADGLREVAHARDVALVIDRHVPMVERLGLDGVHLPDGGRGLRKLRTELGGDRIIGAFCGASRHDGMSAGEAGADYVAFGPVGAAGLGAGDVAPYELFEWWSQMIELPVVAEGALSAEVVERLAPVTDFFAFGAEVWDSPDPAGALGRLIARMR